MPTKRFSDSNAPRLDESQHRRFWWFVAERHRVWHRRFIQENDPPWTNDDIIADTRFTNVYRRLDPGTKYALDTIFSPTVSRPNRLYNAVLYRVIGREETHKAIGLRDVATDTVASLEQDLRNYGEHNTVFTGAYLVAPYHWYGGKDKIENVARLFSDIRDDIQECLDCVDSAEMMQESYEALHGLPGLGEFLAYQVLVDATYPHCEARLWDLPVNEWAKAGPGAQRGLALLTATDDYDENGVMRWLHKNQEGLLDRFGEEFPFLERGGERQRLQLSDVQNCLCEYSKYERIRRGGDPKRTFP